MARPMLYYVRHGETDWNVERRLQGRRDVALNARGRLQAGASGKILARLLAREARAADSFDFLSSPLGRARATMELMRPELGLAPDGYVVEPQLTEISFGRWEGFTLAELQQHDSEGVVERDRDKWNFLPPEGESYRMVAERIGRWYEALARDTVVVAHGGTLRALIAYLGIVPPDTAPIYDIAQGVVYSVADGTIARHG
jgi:probable phosphoglycerate mutase